MKFLENKFFLLALTFGAFFLGKYIQNKTKLIVLNPILIAIVLIISALVLMGVDYEKYREAGQFVDFWLQPAVVALGVPLYLQLKKIKEQWFPILISQLAACFVGIASVTLIAKLLGASSEVIASLAPKSITTPIAMEVSSSLGGVPSLTAAIVIVVGIFGAVLGIQILQIGRVRGNMSMGLSLGAASHAVGTSKAMEVDKEFGAYASLGLSINGILTAILAPIIMELLGLMPA